MTSRLIAADPYLEPHEQFFTKFHRSLRTYTKVLLGTNDSLASFAMGHHHFGLHRNQEGSWTYRDWIPSAPEVYLIGDFSDWQAREEFKMVPDSKGNITLTLGNDCLSHGSLYKLLVKTEQGLEERVPAWARYTPQDANTHLFSASVYEPASPYEWRHQSPLTSDSQLFIYEAHVGMAHQEGGVASYRDFADQIIPRIVQAGYTAVQLMAIMEHPYYGSFGYQVSSFFAPSSRFGTPDDLKYLIDTAHGAGLIVLLDLVHSHAVKNVTEGLSHYDGTPYQYFHEGPRGEHPVWDSRLFDYEKPQIAHFLLSNVRYWLEEFKFDGFRFDGITSMLYRDHGLGNGFHSYDDYFGSNTDLESLRYLALAAELTRELNPDAVLIAEEVSGFPGLAFPLSDGGIGFTHRLTMGVPDLWADICSPDQLGSDEHWNVERLFHEVRNYRDNEGYIGYVESHDQALVGDKTVVFRLLDSQMYTAMSREHSTDFVWRGVHTLALIKALTAFCAKDGYLNFMGNEFGHPEWVDFPREGNGWSYHYARRQWNLADDPSLLYYYLKEFDRALMTTLRKLSCYRNTPPNLIHSHVDNGTLVIQRGNTLMALSFNKFVSTEVPVAPPQPSRDNEQLTTLLDSRATWPTDSVAPPEFLAQRQPAVGANRTLTLAPLQCLVLGC